MRSLLLLFGCGAVQLPASDSLPPATCLALPVHDAAVSYYVAQGFGENDHLGEDWNGNGGGDTDLGDPVLAIGAGRVVEATDHGGGWGNVVRVRHTLHGQTVESLYAHLDRIDVELGASVRRGQQIGTIGTADGLYPAHLHLEVRDRVGMDLGGGYGSDRRGYVEPRAFIAAHGC